MKQSRFIIKSFNIQITLIESNVIRDYRFNFISNKVN